MASCHHCGNKLELARVVSRAESCPNCGRDVRVCLNCQFYDQFAHNQCREPQAELVSEKDKANFCDYFTPGERRAEQDAATAARSKLDKLFTKH